MSSCQPVGRVVYRIALLRMFALAAPPALAGDRPKNRETDQLVQIVHDEIAREDCLWRESLARLSDQTLGKQKIAEAVAYLCSQKTRERIAQGTSDRSRQA